MTHDDLDALERTFRKATEAARIEGGGTGYGVNPLQALTLVAEVRRLRAQVQHWKSHAEEAGEGFTRVCLDFNRANARVREQRERAEAAEAEVERLRASMATDDPDADLIERMARAISKADGCRWPDNAFAQDDWRELARAALAVMREAGA